MIEIVKIDWLSKEAKEAEVCISDGAFSLVCFSQPFNYSLGDRVPLPLYTLNTTDICKVKEDEVFYAERIDLGFEYKIFGRVLNKEHNQIDIGKFIIELDVPLPNDIHVGCFVSFICNRIDLY
ncbi:hypothetical protein [Myroides odoratus]|uniref:hypothetical protein n=1 Tax=Myroides odoratus TaxID=256 RepID=UPI003342DA08